MSVNSFYIYYKMIIFIENIDVSNIEEKLSNLKVNCTLKKYKEIYTNTNIFNIKNNKIVRINIEDLPGEKIIFNNIHIYIDRSKITETEVSIIPFNYIEREITIKMINYNQDKEITFCLKYINNKISDLYFETKNEIFDDYLKNKLFNFISLIFMPLTLKCEI